MVMQKGSELLLKIGDGEEPESFTTVGGLQNVEMRVQNQLHENTALDGDSWRNLISGSGIQFITVSGEGVFSDVASEEDVRASAFASTVKNYELHFGNSDVLSGAFLIARYKRAGDVDYEERTAISLESAGTLTFVVA